MKVRFVEPDGNPKSLVTEPAGSLMELAKARGIDGIEAECGGSMVCGTCHVHVDPDWFVRLVPPSALEADMLEYVRYPDPCARLSCQIELTAALDGLAVSVPPSQR
jgi:ferredoxin, 2Fe-2S